jgi:hypothetical protein
MKNIKKNKSMAVNSGTLPYPKYPLLSYPSWAPEDVVAVHAKALTHPTPINPLSERQMRQIGRLITEDRMKFVWERLKKHSKYFSLRQPNGDAVVWSTSLYFACSRGLHASNDIPEWPTAKLKRMYAKMATDARTLSNAIDSLNDSDLLTVTRFLPPKVLQWLSRSLYLEDIPDFPSEQGPPEHFLALRLNMWLPSIPELLLRLSATATKKASTFRRNTRPTRGDRAIRRYIELLHMHFEKNYRKRIVNEAEVIADIASVIFAASIGVDRVKKQLSRERSPT